MSLDDARRKCEAWRRDYNQERPHGAIGNKAPIELIDRSAAYGPPSPKLPGGKAQLIGRAGAPQARKVVALPLLGSFTADGKRFRLGPQSLEQTRTGQIMTDVERRALSEVRGRIDFGVITMREDEFEAVLKRFGPKWLSIGEQHYNIAELRSHSGALLYCAVVRTPEPGHGDAQLAASQLLTELNPTCLVLIGIGGAKPESEFTLGDVVVGTRLDDFSVTAALAGGRVETSVRGAPSHRLVQTALANLRATKSILGDWNSQAAIGRPLPPVHLLDENFKGDDQWNAKIKDSLTRRFVLPKRLRRPLVTAATLGSGNLLLKDPALFQRWLDFARDLKAVEMEFPGVFAAARSVKGDRPVVAIRGISDVVGFVRDPDWTEYACHSAASFARAFLASELLNIKPKNKKAVGQPATPHASQSLGRGPKRSLDKEKFTLDPTCGPLSDVRSHIPDPASPGISLRGFPRLVVPKGPISNLTIDVNAIAQDGSPLRILRLVVSLISLGDQTRVSRSYPPEEPIILSKIAPETVGLYLMLAGPAKAIRFFVKTAAEEQRTTWESS